MAIGIFIKNPDKKTDVATVHHAHLWGTHSGKYDQLDQEDISATTWTVARPNSPFYLFVPPDERLRDEYEQGWHATKIMPENILGFQTHARRYFYYAYAIFHSPTYRARYADFLKIDFPRLPLTRDWELFQQLRDIGHKLCDVYLMKHADLYQHSVTYPEAGDNVVGDLRWQDERVYINKTQYFGGISEDTWEFMIGGYQVLRKYLEDRKKRTLSDDELTHYMRIVQAIRLTMQSMEDIDEVLTFPVT